MNKNHKYVKKNQLFKIIPTKSFIIDFCKIYGIYNLNSNYKFTIKKLKHNNIIENIKFKELRNYYYNCKAKQFIDNLTYKRSITILRQLLKIIGYNIYGKERCENSIKYQEYCVVKISNNKPISPKSIKKKLTVSFT